MTHPKSDLPQGTLDMLILQIVALGPIHGYAIAQRLQQISRDVVQVQQGSLYPALHRLENRGWLAATWKASDTGRDAKFYQLARKGSEAERGNRELGATRGSDSPDSQDRGRRRAVNWWERLRHRERLDRQLDAELRDHLERLTADYVAGGMDEREAGRTARLHFGGLDQVKEACRDENAALMMCGAMLQDFKYAVRRFLQMPGFTLSAVIVLALGIGVNTAMFDIVHTLLFAAPPFSTPSDSRGIFRRTPESDVVRAFPIQPIVTFANRTVFSPCVAFDLFPIGLDSERYAPNGVHGELELLLRARHCPGDGPLSPPQRRKRPRPAFVAIVCYAYC